MEQTWRWRCLRGVLALCEDLAEDLGGHVFAVAYLTPAGSQAVPVHNDDQDVFVYQVWGTKRWTVSAP